ncbi:protein VACUOLELESS GAMETOPHYTES-like [Rhododendron vialii]|uniref:protein VACUOLELESS GAMETOPHYTES-like n=1 Tax=Rhododendron vialii TaxID=182163 RepID=UPI00265F5D7D|nr:protein VACUOLELESS GAMETOPHYTES-like [Rhododendron vialii]
MAMEVVQVLQHLGHDHPLMLIKPEETDDSWDLSCYGCQQPISISSSASSYYGCKRCVFFLHKSCAELPHHMTHPSHPQHPLTLHPNPILGNVCDVCRGSGNRFLYRCYDCDYDIDIKCALVVLSIQQSIEHTSHPHQLIPMRKESTFSCDACGIKHEGTSFLCTTCGFWINQKCASSPINLKLNNHHHHTLSLIYILPERHECQICSEEICRRNWAYSCSECHYRTHLHCALLDKGHSTYTSALQLFSFLLVNDFLCLCFFYLFI